MNNHWNGTAATVGSGIVIGIAFIIVSNEYILESMMRNITNNSLKKDQKKQATD
jgi:hypothetical protein